MNLSNLKPAEGSTKTRKRIGRGAGSGLGGTSTRGHKGAKSRSGYSKKIGFEGGQMPLQRRVPKFGFKNINRIEYKAINLETIQKLAEAKKLEKVGVNDFIEAGFISSSQLVKVLGNGTLTAKLSVEAHAFSKSAVAAIEAAGGNVVKLVCGDLPFRFVRRASWNQPGYADTIASTNKRGPFSLVKHVLRRSIF